MAMSHLYSVRLIAVDLLFISDGHVSIVFVFDRNVKSRERLFVSYFRQLIELVEQKSTREMHRNRRKSKHENEDKKLCMLVEHRSLENVEHGKHV
jgi:hypothetical protein